MLRRAASNCVEGLLLVMMVALCADVFLGVFSRYVMRSTFTWYDEIARLLGFHDVIEMQAGNPVIDFSQPPREGDVLQSSTEAAPGNSPGDSTTTAGPSSISSTSG